MSIVFVAGGRRTGTTLVENIVCSYERVNPALSEAQLITRLMETLKWASDEDVFPHFIQHTFPSRADLVCYFSGILQDYARRTREVHRASTAVFKNPEYSLVLDELLLTAPEARFIFCVRDPRDQIASELDVLARRRQMLGKDHPVAQPRTVASLAREVHTYYERALAREADSGERFLFLRYEDVVRNFPGTMAKLDAFTGLKGNCFDPAGKWPRNVEAGLEVADYPTWSPLYGQPLADTSVGRFRQLLAPGEIHEIEQLCAPAMERFGYEALPYHREPAAEPEIGADLEAASFLKEARFSTDTPAEDLQGLLRRVRALKATPELSAGMQAQLEAFRRAARGALDWTVARQAGPY